VSTDDLQKRTASLVATSGEIAKRIAQMTAALRGMAGDLQKTKANIDADRREINALMGRVKGLAKHDSLAPSLSTAPMQTRKRADDDGN